MLPHLLHSTTRAVAVVQNQTHTIRNVLQLQSSGPSSGSGSNWGNGPGPGGSKFNTGSRFYAGYNSAGRAVTQANAVTSYDGTVSQADDTEDIVPRRTILPTPPKRHRMRSSSVSLSVAGRTERGEKMGVLKTVQLHARGRHAFASIETLASAKKRLLADTTEPPPPPPSGPLLIRRNSTSAPLSPLLDASTPLPSEETKQLTRPNTPVQTKVPTPTPSPAPAPAQEAVDPFISRFQYLAKTSDEAAVAEALRKMLLAVAKPTVEQFNAALQATIETRTAGQPLNSIIKLYNTMLERSILPTVQTYENLIHALVDRDTEVHKAILSLEMRMKRAPLEGRREAATLEADQGRIAKLREEDNFPSAMSLFEGVLAIGAKDQLSHATYTRLLSSCANHSDVNAAIHIFAQLESIKDMKLGPGIYRNMILTFSNAKKIENAEQTFEAFIAASQTGNLKRYPVTLADAERRSQILVWNVMIEAYFRASMPDKAIELVDRMLHSTAGDNFLPHHTPIATSSTFTTVIAGFILSGDLQSARTWFDNLLGQERTPANPFEGLDGKAMRPDSVAWHLMIDALAAEGNLEELNRLYTIMKSICEEDNLQIRPADHIIIHRANMNNLQNLDNDAALQTLQFLLDDLAGFESDQENWVMKVDICNEFVSRGYYDTPCALIGEAVLQELQKFGNALPPHRLLWLQKISLDFMNHVYNSVAAGKGELPFLSALGLARVGFNLSLKQELKFAPFILHSYGHIRSLSLLPYEELYAEDWNILISYAVHFEDNALKGNPNDLHVVPNFAFNGLASLMDDMASHGVQFDTVHPDTRRKVVEVLGLQYGEQGRDELLGRLGPTYLEASREFGELQYSSLENSLTQSPDSSSSLRTETSATSVDSFPNLTIDRYHSRVVEEALRANSRSSERYALEAYELFQKGLEKGVVPQILTFGHLIESLGRLNDLDKVRELYSVAQSTLPLLHHNQQHAAWVRIEDSMIIALAHSGHVDAAHVHRLRILEQGGCPSSDAYGVLIQHVKDTTDDASAGLSLFQEAIERGVRPNLYLYNNIISKLSKARKADYALELFQQMKASGVNPSSITYGAVIGACARVGDVVSAENLYHEMTHAPDFKPRVPPYNTMMQLYTTTKPNRRSVLYYRDEMRQAGVRPSAHTYKLLLDAYGSIEPVDLKSMDAVFAELQQNTTVEITGAHFASLINAYGCVSKDLDKALAIFESMHRIPRAPPPDAVVFEAVVNVIVAHKRTDLIPIYISKMTQAGVHMTAYIANFLIKGYANVNDMEQARVVFEALADPPTGVAAPNNHAPHSPSSSPEVPVMEPVYREPSTWEVMVRAELGAGNRDAAIGLLERLRERQYPEAVYNRISGVLTDHSVPL
ncbi:hypothetical protein GALMADRAFT_123802 [Galerina marginata CBS 339.88]|uniref:PROP1-like PPR domain-containing protein n=1 Tax=Galerina marginata (strain CBS 339.88) TaxID=685588 RepID=A0A067STY5_GALM3|nr:hypothetical protein GALMADRAFT_123802 [Galerina marginata CBS 339.88]